MPLRPRCIARPFQRLLAGEDRVTFDNVPVDFVKIAQFSSPGACPIDRQCKVPIDFFIKQLNHLLAAHIGGLQVTDASSGWR